MMRVILSSIAAVLLIMLLSACGENHTYLKPTLQSDLVQACPAQPPLVEGDNLIDKYFELSELYSVECAPRHAALIKTLGQ